MCSANGSPRRRPRAARRPGLGGAHDGADVAAAEDALDGHRVGARAVEEVVEPDLEQAQPSATCRSVEVRTTPHVRPATAAARETPRPQADAAAGQARVDSQHAHARLLVVRTPVRTTLGESGRLGGADTPTPGASGSSDSMTSSETSKLAYTFARRRGPQRRLDEAEHLARPLGVELDLHAGHE